MLVSNKEYLEFIQDGGYSNQSFWCKDGWKYVQNHNSKVPRWWINQDKQRLLLEEVPI
jgi:formylglycine-generating enzyme required for sulfatase activity